MAALFGCVSPELNSAGNEMIPAAKVLLADQSDAVRSLFSDVYSALVHGSGCRPDVKTIYVSFTLGDSLVASAHPRADVVELALALPEAHGSTLLEDASHLTWRTLPLLVCIEADSPREDVMDLVYEAVNRVESGEHDVDRPPEFFQAARRANKRNRFWETLD